MMGFIQWMTIQKRNMCWNFCESLKREYQNRHKVAGCPVTDVKSLNRKAEYEIGSSK